ncbi:MAG: general secretion pathway protein GspB [Woeseiaceae bacterium]|nr:general secretion pathway protein GspB [Woeseiaceae bacterium]
MSFILDALKKSESDRQQQGSAEFANVPVSTGDDGPPRWLWVVGVLLLVNIVVVAALLMRPAVRPTVQAPAPQPVATVAAEAAPDQQFAEEIAAARQTTLPREEPVAPDASAPAPAEATAASVPATSEPANPLALPTAQEVVANGMLTLPTLHVDVHVYSESPADRFIFINMTKHKEGSVLSEGPRVQSITPEGVVLSQNGITFLLPRD